MTPKQVKACSVWEFDVAVAGWIDAHVAEAPGSMSEAEKDELWAWMQERA